MRTPQPKPNKLHDELDALLDGRPVELTDELAPLVEAADALRAELATFELDPEVADRHLERVLERPGTVLELPVRRHQPSGWEVRRRVVAVALAAALVLAPATIASAAALPGQAMYPFKRAIEQLRVASVQWSPAREATERTRLADVRRDELAKLTQLRMFNQIEPAVKAVKDAVLAAQRAVADAEREGVARSEVAALAGRLDSVEGKVDVTFNGVAYALRAAPATAVSREMLRAALDAVDDSREVLEPHGTPSTPGPPVTTPEPKESEKPTQPSDPGGPNTGPDPTQGSTPTESSQSSNTTQTTESTTTTTEPEPESTTTTEAATPGSLESGGGSPAPSGKAPDEAGTTPTTTLPAP